MALWGIGTKFQIENQETWEEIGDITSITPPEMTTDTLETTALDSPDGTEEIIPTIHRNGEASIAFNFDPDDDKQKAFNEDRKNRVKRNYRIVFPDGSFYQFAAYVVGFAIGDITPDGLLTATVTLRATGSSSFGKNAQ